ncbi:hypothetical protein SprV_0802507700 [Sparganum proliferum]
MGLFGHMRIHESGIDRSLDKPSTSCTPTMPSPANTPPHSAPASTSFAISITEADTGTTNFSCPHCSCAFTPRIGLVDHLRIHPAETGGPVPGTPIYTHHIRLHCPHCTRTFIAWVY